MESSRIRAVEIGNRKGLLGIRRMDKVPNARNVQIEERIDEGVLR